MSPNRSTDSVLGGVRLAVEWMLVAVVVGAALVAVVVPRLAGATPYAVGTGSMGPDLPPGSLVVVRPVDPADLDVGAVVTFMPRPDDPDVVTHRIVGQGFDAAGRPVYRTQGDANDAPDPGTVRAEQILGQRWYSVPYLGHVTALLGPRERTAGVYRRGRCTARIRRPDVARARSRDRVRRPRVSHV